jgi:hypothetical protein
MGNGFTSDMAIDDIQITVAPIVACSGDTKTWDGLDWSPAGAPTSDDIVIINHGRQGAGHDATAVDRRAPER